PIPCSADSDCPMGLTCSAGICEGTPTSPGRWALQNRATTANLNSIKFVSLNRGVAVGENGILMRTNNGGVSWTFGTRSFMASGTSYVYGSVDSVNPNTFFASGSG